MKEKICIEITSKEDEKKWKEFLRIYFPNHYAKDILNKDLVIDVESAKLGLPYLSKMIGVSETGFGYLNAKFAYYGGYERVKDFEEFKSTDCYRIIIKNGVSYKEGEPEVITINSRNKNS